jgi:hypothetical protein
MHARHLIVPLLTVTAALVGLGCPPPPATSLPSATSLAPPTSPGPSTSFSAAPDALQGRIESAIDLVKRRELEPAHGFWTIFHGILGLGPEIPLLDRKTGQRVKALDYVRQGGEMPGLRFEETRDGLDVFTATEQERFFAQGHQDQFIAEMAQWGVPADLSFRVNGKDYTFRDFVRHTKARASVTRKQELAWALHVLGEYEGTDIAWTNRFGEQVHFEDLVRYEVESPMDDEGTAKAGLPPLACGGTHRLFGLSWVYHLHLQKGGATTGAWKDLVEKRDRYKKLARLYQNSDGTFSTNWFNGRGDAADKRLRLNTTGHTLEWLALALSDEELRQPWVQEAANALTLLIFDLHSEAVEGGSLYHAVHGLLIYYARVYGPEKLGPHTPYVPLPPVWKAVKRP